MTVPAPFPKIQLDYKTSDANPAIQLFGRRFFSDQTVLEYLVEFLLVAHSKKKLGHDVLIDTLFPSWQELQRWTSEALLYSPPTRLCLKLFAFLGSSKLETRHPSHRKQYETLLNRLQNKIHASEEKEKENILKTLENLFLGFQGAGFDRTWCAQTFTPVSNALILNETIWKDKAARKANVQDWKQALNYFTASQRLFLARGGELLYLQICNALRAQEGELTALIEKFPLTEEERDPKSLHQDLERYVGEITRRTSALLDPIAELIDEADGFTAEEVKSNNDWVSCGWCPEESRPEGYLFAVELLRLCRAALDPVERIELLSIGCALQVLRSLCAQSARYAPLSDESRKHGGGLGYAWIISDPDGEEARLKQLSQRNLQIVEGMIHQALRHKDIQERTKSKASKSPETLYREADTKYGHKLFLSLAKKIGLIVPHRGPGVRFVFNDKILRYLVLALVPPGHRVTYDDFRTALYTHYGIAVEAGELERAVLWSDLPPLGSSAVQQSGWLVERLLASGFLLHLSDACSLVHNPFDDDECVSTGS